VEATSRRDDLGVRVQHFATRPRRRRRKRRKRTRPSSRARRVTRRDDATRAFLFVLERSGRTDVTREFWYRNNAEVSLMAKCS
jgi:hypothetical protein